MTSGDETKRDEAALGETVRRLLADGHLDLPDPADGETARRLIALAEIARDDLAVARLVEAHTDAVSILREAGRSPEPGLVYGVWAAEESGRVLTLDTGPAGNDDGDVPADGSRVAVGRLRGVKPFCTGATLVDRALVTCRSADGVLLWDVDARSDDVVYADHDWVSPAFAATCTATATFDGVVVDTDAVVGPPGWYLDRTGFWHGACGPAACWAGGAIGLIDRAVDLAAAKPAEPHLDAHVGALVATRWALNAVLQQAGDEIDRFPDDRDGAVHRARMLRHLVDRSATEVVERFGRALGPRPLIRDVEVVRRIAELQLYVRQCHAERDLDALGAAVLAPHRQP